MIVKSEGASGIGATIAPPLVAQQPHNFSQLHCSERASSWNWFGVNNEGIHANGFSCDRIMCYIIDQRERPL